MAVRVGIGDFARMTHLSVKALRHYHDVGLLEPAEVDRSTGYRFYDAGQVPVAQVIRRFRDLGMPIDEVRAVLTAPDVITRNEVIVAHLDRMEAELARTQTVVSSLRSLLERPPAPVPVEYRSVPPATALAIAEQVSAADMEEWWPGAFTELFGAVDAAGLTRTGVSGALYPDELFEIEAGEVTAFVPVSASSGGNAALAPGGRARLVTIPGAELAIALHAGAFSELDRTYGALGTYIAERELGVEGPIREYYLVGPFDTPDESQHRTEVGWPVFQTAAPGA